MRADVESGISPWYADERARLLNATPLRYVWTHGDVLPEKWRRAPNLALYRAEM